MNETPTRYIALGDSISIDVYPQHETGRSGLGAVSLLYRNDDEFWPEFRGRDLKTKFPAIELVDLTADGATTTDVLSYQLSRVAPTDDPCLVTITAGGNDMLMHLRSPDAPRNLAMSIITRLESIVSTTEKKFRRAQILLGTVYDPSDGTNVLYGERLDREAEWLADVNAAIRKIATSHDRVTLIDIHKHFLGHGLTAPERERWYWSGLIFEPSARGASEVRRLWLAAL